MSNNDWGSTPKNIDREPTSFRFLRKLRQSVNWSQSVMADLLALSLQTIVDYEANDRQHRRINPFAVAAARRMETFAQSTEGRGYLTQMAGAVLCLEPTERADAVMVWLCSRKPPEPDGSYERLKEKKHVRATNVGALVHHRNQAHRAVRKKLNETYVNPRKIRKRERERKARELEHPPDPEDS